MINLFGTTTSHVAEPGGRRTHRRWRFYFLAGVATGATLGVAVG
jgi:hypothetical protein